MSALRLAVLPGVVVAVVGVAGHLAVTIALTVLVVVLAGVGHAPAAAMTLLVASGIAGPGKPLLVLVLAPVLTRLTVRRRA